MIELSKTLEHLANRKMTKAQRKKFVRDHGEVLRNLVDGNVPMALHGRLCHSCEEHVERVQEITETSIKDKE